MPVRDAQENVRPGALGRRDKWITLQQLQAPDAPGESGMAVEEFEPLVTNPSNPTGNQDVPAAKEDLSGREEFASGAGLSTPYDTRFEIAYRADMDPELIDVTKKRRILYLGRTYDIVQATQIGRRLGIELLTLSRGGG